MDKILSQHGVHIDFEMIDRLFSELSNVDSWDYGSNNGVVSLSHRKVQLLIRVQEVSGGMRGLFYLEDEDITFVSVMYICNGHIEMRLPLSCNGKKLYFEYLEEARLKWIIRNEGSIFNTIKGFDLPEGEKNDSQSVTKRIRNSNSKTGSDKT